MPVSARERQLRELGQPETAASRSPPQGEYVYLVTVTFRVAMVSSGRNTLVRNAGARYSQRESLSAVSCLAGKGKSIVAECRKCCGAVACAQHWLVLAAGACR